jgi:SAM-dependent methyltransferase/uncharacterized protein YbaR (Trm112 family)
MGRLDQVSAQPPWPPSVDLTMFQSLSDLLACPACGSELLGSDAASFVCSKCKATYPILNGIPRLVPPGWFDSVEGKWGAEEMEHWEHEYGDRLGNNNDPGAGLRWENRTLPRDRNLFRRLRALPSQERLRVLDVGCGAADTMRDLLPNVPGAVYVGTDLSLNALQFAAQNVPHATFIQAATQALPFRRQAFDVLLVLGVMHHLPDPAKATRELVERHLRPHGALLLYEGIDRPLPLPRAWVERFMPEESEHEDRIPEQRLLEELSAVCSIEHVQKEYTPARTALIAALGNRLGTPRRGCLLRSVDALCASTLGRLIPAFQGGSLFVYATRL